MTQGDARRAGSLRPESGAATPSDQPAHGESATREAFSAGFDRCFGRVYSYVSRRVGDQKVCERIVREVLAGNLDLLQNRSDERQELSQLRRSSDRWIGLASAEGFSCETLRP
jgi:hypothetical protein